MEKYKWWGYTNEDYMIKVAPWVPESGGVMKNLSRLPFTDTIYGPFEADNREDAINIIKEKIKCQITTQEK